MCPSVCLSWYKLRAYINGIQKPLELGKGIFVCFCLCVCLSGSEEGFVLMMLLELSEGCLSVSLYVCLSVMPFLSLSSGPPGHEPAVNFLSSTGLSQAVDAVSPVIITVLT